MAPILFISHGSSWSFIPAAFATCFPSSINSCNRCPRPENCDSSAKCGECGNPVSADTPLTDALKISFDHWAGRASCSASAFRPPALIKSAASFHKRIRGVARLEWADPCCRIEFQLHMRVAMLCAAHKSCAPNDLSARVSRDDLFAAKPVLRRDHRALIETVADQRDRVLHLRRFGGHDAEFAIGQLIRLRCCLE